MSRGGCSRPESSLNRAATRIQIWFRTLTGKIPPELTPHGLRTNSNASNGHTTARSGTSSMTSRSGKLTFLTARSSVTELTGMTSVRHHRRSLKVEIHNLRGGGGLEKVSVNAFPLIVEIHNLRGAKVVYLNFQCSATT
eukprot:gene18787-biopygen5644